MYRLYLYYAKPSIRGSVIHFTALYSESFKKTFYRNLLSKFPGFEKWHSEINEGFLFPNLMSGVENDILLEFGGFDFAQSFKVVILKLKCKFLGNDVQLK